MARDTIIAVLGILFGLVGNNAQGQPPAPAQLDIPQRFPSNAKLRACRPVSSRSSVQESQATIEAPAPEPNGKIVSVVEPPLQSWPGMEFETGIHPYYVVSGEESLYVSECKRCRHRHCRCTYAPFGDSLRAAFGQQAYRGAAQLLTLYSYDFEHSGSQSMLTSRGMYQLQKIVRQLAITPAPIKIEATVDPARDAARREHVIGLLIAWGVPEPAGLVTTIRANKGRPAIESLETANGLLESLRSRGRTIQAGESATFSGGALFGQ